MKLIRSIALSIALTSSLALAGCSGGDSSGEDGIEETDIVDLGDLITDEADAAAAAAQIGDPATLRAEARRQAGIAREDVGAVFKFMRAAADGQPTNKGTTPNGRPFALWEKNVEGVDVRLTVIRVLQGRLRYLLQGKAADGTYIPLLTGIFAKRKDHAGGGRFHVSLTNVSDLYGAPEADGTLHFWFANNRDDKRGRRIHYRNVTRRDEPGAAPVNFAADLVRKPGVGGRFRSRGIVDALPDQAGSELFALRAIWKTGEGGRGDAAMASLQDPMSPTPLGKAHECWDADGLRTAYMDTYAGNDMENPNEGDTANCFGLAEEDVPEGAARPDGTDADPELEELLAESGSAQIDEVEADLIEEAPGR